MSRRSKFFYTILSCAVAFCDQLSKLWALSLVDNPIVFNKFLTLSYAENNGAMWSLWRGSAPLLAVLGVGAMILLHAISRYFETHLQMVALSIIFGGIVGNTIDRIFRGHVIDFIAVNFKFYRWPTFNVADGALCSGVVILLFTLCKKEQKEN
jgi:signal peptidase II